MKKILLIAIITLFGMSMSFDANAQKKKREMVKATISADIHCGKCKARIDNNATKLGSGVKSVDVDLEKDIIVVVYDKSKSNIKDIMSQITKLKIADVKLKKEEAVVTKSKKKK